VSCSQSIFIEEEMVESNEETNEMRSRIEENGEKREEISVRGERNAPSIEKLQEVH